MLISPFNTFTICGISSSENRRRNRPTRVTRGVFADLEEGSFRLVRFLELRLERRLGHHRAELEHPELALADADTPVDEEDRATRVQLDGQGDQSP